MRVTATEFAYSGHWEGSAFAAFSAIFGGWLRVVFPPPPLPHGQRPGHAHRATFSARCRGVHAGAPSQTSAERGHSVV